MSTEASLLSGLAAEVEREFQASHSRPPTVIVAAPGRVNLIGEHIDYNDGFVLPMAIERYVVLAASPAGLSRKTACIRSANLDDCISIALNGERQSQTGDWSSYIEGVIAGFRNLGESVPAFDAVLKSNIPLGAGLSSSAAVEVAVATLLEGLTGRSLEPTDKAVLCQQAEHQFAGVPCGIMDQVSSVFGQVDELLLLDCRSLQIQPVPFASDEVAVLITNSNVQHELVGGEYGERREQCDSALAKLGRSSWRDVTMAELDSGRGTLGPTEYRRARHVVSEIARTVSAAGAIHNQDWSGVGQLMYASHDSLRDDFQVSCRELDTLVLLAQQIGVGGGVFGARMTGGGFGGSTVSLVKNDSVQTVSQQLTSRYEAATGIRPSCFASRPAHGAHVIRG